MNALDRNNGTTTILTNICCAIISLAIVLTGVVLEYPRLGTTFVQSRVVSPSSGEAQSSGRRVFLGDPDDYMRVYRAKKILAGEAYRIRRMPEIGHPRGVELHWTAPMDYLLVGVGSLFAPHIDHPDPFGAAAAFVPLVLGALYAIALMGWIRRGFGWGPALLVGLVVVWSQPFHRVFRLGHPDHHALLEFLFVIAIGAWVGRRREEGGFEPPTRVTGLISGLAAGLAIWIASHAMLIWTPLAVAITFACYRAEDNERSDYLAARLRWNFTVAAVVLVGFLVENWPDLHSVAIDKISLVHVALAVLSLLVPVNPSARARQAPKRASEQRSRHSAAVNQRRTNRTILFLAALAVFTVWIAVKFDAATATVSSPELSRWHDLVAELQPLHVHAGGEWSLKKLHSMLGLLPYAMPLLWLLFVYSRRVPPVLKCCLGLLAPLLLVLTIRQIRWMDHYNLAVVPVAVIGLFEMLRRVLPNSFGSELRLAAAAVVLFLLVYPPVFLLMDRRSKHLEIDNILLDRADFVAHSIAQFEQTNGPPPADRNAILCEEGDGPFFLYHTGRPVVAAPYHRAIDGISAVARFFAERDPIEARSQLDRLGVRYVVMPDHPHQRLLNFEKIAFGESRSFDPPIEELNEYGVVVTTPRYRPQVVETMAHRLAMEWEKSVIPGLRCLRTANEGAKTPDGRPARTGLLYVVD